MATLFDPVPVTEPRRWDQRFRDPAIEREYQLAGAASAQRTYRALTLLLLVIWVSGFAVDRETSGTAANYDTLLLLRYAVGLPLVLLAVVPGVAPASLFVRWKTAGVGALVTALVLVPFAMTLAIPDPEAFRLSAVPGITATVVAYACFWALWSARLDVLVFGVLPAYTGLGLTMAVRFPAAGTGLLGFSVLVTLGAAITAAWLIDRARRDAFAATLEVARERARSEALIASMLPAPIAERLKHSRDSIAEHFDEATVLFADLAGFTPLSSELGPAEVVAALDDLFSDLDELTRRHGLEKIKTIGDAYMVAGGVPTPRPDHVAAVTAMALDMRDLVAAKTFAGGRRLSLRIGVDTGPVVAGVLGRDKPVYDLWGDIVNTASRMESHGVPGKIHVTASVASCLDRDSSLSLESRGEIAIKGKGEMRTWFVERAR